METANEAASAGATAEALRAQQKKLSARAMNLKMELHDLSEELPLGWEKIPDVAQRAHAAFAALTELRARIAALGA
jgi:hypothetical protein